MGGGTGILERREIKTNKKKDPCDEVDKEKQMPNKVTFQLF